MLIILLLIMYHMSCNTFLKFYNKNLVKRGKEETDHGNTFSISRRQNKYAHKILIRAEGWDKMYQNLVAQH